MSNFSEMDWNAKWDWESESPKKLQLVDWTIMDDGEIGAASFNLSSGGGNSGASASDGGHVSSSKSSISDSSKKERMQTPDFRLITFEDFPGKISKKMELKETKFSGSSSLLESSIGSAEPLIGLKLGKRTYFENGGAGGNGKNAAYSVMPTPSTTSLKKTKSTGQNLHVPHCIVEGCNVDLSVAKEYHRKHRVCDNHSKCPKVIVGGLERRFCQQCSRFHNLSEFDEKKRSCRRRLSDHNARRRKPHQETVQFSSTRLTSSPYGGRQPMSFPLNNAPLLHSRNLANAPWDSTYNSKFTLTNGCPSKSSGDGGSCNQMHVSGIKLPHLMQTDSARGILPSKSSISGFSNPGSKGSQFSASHLDAAPEYHHRALSLLSSNSWGSCGPESMPLNPVHEESNTCVNQPMMHGIPEGVPLPSSELWLPPHQLSHPRTQPLALNSNFPEIQLFITPFDTDLYPSILH